jgi:hypothetical protein
MQQKSSKTSAKLDIRRAAPADIEGIRAVRGKPIYRLARTASIPKRNCSAKCINFPKANSSPLTKAA